jgi:hypothetical protein
MKNSSDPTGIRTRDLSSFSTVPQPTSPPRTTPCGGVRHIYISVLLHQAVDKHLKFFHKQDFLSGNGSFMSANWKKV